MTIPHYITVDAKPTSSIYSGARESPPQLYDDSAAGMAVGQAVTIPSGSLGETPGELAPSDTTHISIRILTGWLESVALGTSVVPARQVDALLAYATAARDASTRTLVLGALALALPTERAVDMVPFLDGTMSGLRAAQALVGILCSAPPGPLDSHVPGLADAFKQLVRPFSVDSPHLAHAIGANLMCIDALIGVDIDGAGPVVLARMFLDDNIELTSSDRAREARRRLSDAG